MRTLIIIVIGLVVLAAFVAVARFAGRTSGTGARWFLLPWLVVALVNLYMGTMHGYTVLYELPFFALVFGVPAAAAAAVIRWTGDEVSARV